jgi:hypothetical protein
MHLRRPQQRRELGGGPPRARRETRSTVRVLLALLDRQRAHGSARENFGRGEEWRG